MGVVQGSGFRMRSAGRRVQDARLWAQQMTFESKGLGFGISGVRLATHKEHGAGFFIKL